MNEYVHEGILKAVDFIEENLDSKINVKDMAEASGYSVFYFSRQFNGLTGHSPYDYLMRRRLSEAAFDVLEDKSTLTDIAFKYQFRNYETFSRGFQRMFNMSPSDFRNSQSVHFLQWKRRFSSEYIKHLNEHKYRLPNHIYLSEQLVSGEVVTDRHFNEVQNISNETTNCYVHSHRKHRHLHEYAFMKGTGLYGSLIDSIYDSKLDEHCKVIPEGKFIKFLYKGSYFQIQNVYAYIFETWIPQAGLDVEVPFVLEKIHNDLNGDIEGNLHGGLIETEIFVPI